MSETKAPASMPVFPDDFWERIRLHREAMEMTLDDLSHDTGVPVDALERLERGEDVPISTLVLVFKRLGLALDFARGVMLMTPIPKDVKVVPLTEDELHGWF